MPNQSWVENPSIDTNTSNATLYKIKTKIGENTGRVIKDNNGVPNESMSPTSNWKSSKKSIFILGDSMLKHIQAWVVTKPINNE